MDVRNFIKLVNKNTCLWDPGDASYHSRDLQRNAWQKISDEIDLPVDEIKKRWRGLRDTFGKELKKANAKKSDRDTATDIDSKWPHFKHLLFLRNTMSRRESKVPPETFESNFEEDNADVNTRINSPSPLSSGESSDDEPPRKIFKSPVKVKVNNRQSDTNDTRILQIEEEKIQYFNQSANDADTQFLMSLLPFLKDTPKHRKLTVRAKLQQVFLDEEQLTSTEDTKLFYDSS